MHRMMPKSTAGTVCRICGSTNIDAPILVPETMFRTGEEFGYHRCFNCGCLQIVEMPSEMDRYYPENYYSYSLPATGASQWLKTKVRAFLSHYGPRQFFEGCDWWAAGDRRSLREAGISRSARILDLGCGSGGLIASLRDIGFRNVIGADPYISSEIIHRNGVRVLKCEAGEIEGEFDVVMMHHSLEHVRDQRAVVNNIVRLLVPGGYCIIRIPTIDSWAWEEYGIEWVQLDAPRHFYLHSRASIVRLLETAGLHVITIADDSFSYSLLGSEKIRRGQPVIDRETGNTDFALVLPEDLIAWAPERARQLNRSGRGDSIAVHARKKSSNLIEI